LAALETLQCRSTALTRPEDPMENTLPITDQSAFFGSLARCEPAPAQDCREGSFPLRLARECEWVRVVAMNGGPGFHDRLAGMGLHVGAELQVLCNPMDGKLIVCLDGTRLFLGGGMAQKIQVVITKGITE
jgi:Fe2+ transport system protein FeoA